MARRSPKQLALPARRTWGAVVVAIGASARSASEAPRTLSRACDLPHQGRNLFSQGRAPQLSKYLRAPPGFDPRSSGPWFDACAQPQAEPSVPSPVAAPRTWLASVGWRGVDGSQDPG